jgi:hypothetical protein
VTAPAGDDEPSLVELDRYPDSALAHIIRGRLEAEGIPAFCFDSGMNLAEGAPMIFGVRVMVFDTDLDAARALVAQDDAAVMDMDQPFAEEAPDLRGHDGAQRRRRLLWIGLGLIVLPPLLFHLTG